MNPPTDTLILGGGWTGLLCAYLLSQQNHPFILLEKNPSFGGLAKSLEWEGFTFDIGGHRFYFHDQSNQQILSQLYTSWIPHQRISKIYFNGDFIDYPPSLKTLKHIHKVPTLKILLDLLKSRKFNKDEHLESWIRYYYGDTLFNLYFREYTKKAWGVSSSELSSCWAEERIGKFSIIEAIRNLFLSSSSSKENSRKFIYPKGSMSALLNAIVKKIEPHGQILSSISPKSIQYEDQTLSSIQYEDSQGNSKTQSFKNLISTIPLPSLGNLIYRDNNPLSKHLKFRNYLLIALKLNIPKLTPYHWAYFPQPQYLLSRIYEPKNWDSNCGPQKETLLCVEMICDNHGTWSFDNKDLIARIKKELEEIFHLQPDLFFEEKVFRFPNAYPLFLKDTPDHLKNDKDLLTKFSNLQLGGRSGSFAYLDMEECLKHAKEMTKKLLLSK